MDRYIKINSADNVAVAVHPLFSGETVEIDGLRLTLSEDIPAGHKFALMDLHAGDNVIKYGFPIGHLTADAHAGSRIDHSKLRTNLEGLLDYTYSPALTEIPSAAHTMTFKGFRRSNGTVGIRNQIWIIPTVGCVNGTVERLEELFRKEIEGREGSVDAVVAFPHNYGCSQLGDDHENTRKILRDMVLHPNAGGVLVVGLGCENNQMNAFRELVGPVDSARIRFMETQKVEGDEIEYGLEQLRGIFEACRNDRREEVPVSELKVGLKCGGSDGLSGITANPLLGLFSDWIVSQGGTTVLTEVPEMFGAETLLMNRCCDRPTFDSLVSMINDFKEYFIRNGQPKRHPQIRRPPESQGSQPAERPWQRPRSLHRPRLFRMSDSAVHHRTRHSLRNLRAHDEGVHQHPSGRAQAAVDRFQRRRARRGHIQGRAPAEVHSLRTKGCLGRAGEQ